MPPIPKALFLGALIIAIAVLATFGLVPKGGAQFAPLAALPLVLGNRQPSCPRFGARGA